ncbi:uncharacterized protein LOC135812077 [Sycon ciliatum]|uniref:uncharacterized protein LOC135812077 n=1 Tax=Sycon ciliatum TaxID=27933 RepID=UPI0020AC672F
MATAYLAQAVSCTRGYLQQTSQRAQDAAQRYVPRERLERFARRYPLAASFALATVVCGALPSATFLSFVLFSACTLLIMALAVELVVIGIAFVIFLIVMGIVLALAGGLTVPIAVLWIGYNTYSGTPVAFPPFASAAASSGGTRNSGSERGEETGGDALRDFSAAPSSLSDKQHNHTD